VHSAVTPAIYTALHCRGVVGSHASADEEDTTARMTRDGGLDGSQQEAHPWSAQCSAGSKTDTHTHHGAALLCMPCKYPAPNRKGKGFNYSILTLIHSTGINLNHAHERIIILRGWSLFSVSYGDRI